jgi:hypothetical protein
MNSASVWKQISRFHMSCGRGKVAIVKKILFRIHHTSFHPTSLLEDVATA